MSPSRQVWREFQTTFRQQEQMKTFLQFGTTEVKQGQWGRRSAASALKKEANWIPFIRVGIIVNLIVRFFRYFSLCLFLWAAREIVRESVRKSGETSLIESIIKNQGNSV